MTEVPEFTFVRPPLQDASKQIRLLQIRPTEERFPNDIHCTLSVHDLDDVSDNYVAISYTWGSPDQPVYICINNQRAQVRFNCWHALWQMRHHEVNKYYWLDSLCIDQECHGEKSLQIVRMGDIYSHACQVAICLGECNDNGFHEYLENYSDGPRSGHDFTRHRLQDWLVDHPYFHRLWTLQECTLAKYAVIFYGSSKATARIMAEALRLEPIILRTSVTLSLRNVLLPEHTAGTYDLASLICSHRDRHCFEPRDQLYGLLSLIPPTFASLIVVDYQLPLVDVLENYIKAYITSAEGASPGNPPFYLHSAALKSVRILVRAFAVTSDNFTGLLNTATIRHFGHIAHAVAANLQGRKQCLGLHSEKELASSQAVPRRLSTLASTRDIWTLSSLEDQSCKFTLDEAHESQIRSLQNVVDEMCRVLRMDSSPFNAMQKVISSLRPESLEKFKVARIISGLENPLSPEACTIMEAVLVPPETRASDLITVLYSISGSDPECNTIEGNHWLVGRGPANRKTHEISTAYEVIGPAYSLSSSERVPGMKLAHLDRRDLSATLSSKDLLALSAIKEFDGGSALQPLLWLKCHLPCSMYLCPEE